MSGNTVKNLLGMPGFAPLIHVAVLCPPNGALTLILNKMGELGGMFVLLSQVPVQVSNIAKANGQDNIMLYPLVIFAIHKKAWEDFTGRAYNPTDVIQMEEILDPGKVKSSLIN